MSLPKRKSNRLPQFDYGTVGAYFITICSRDKAKVFGRVVGGGVLDAPRTLPSPHGKIVIAQIEAMENFYPDLQIEKFVVMPNHIHLIIAITQGPSGASRTPPPASKFYVCNKRRTTCCNEKCLGGVKTPPYSADLQGNFGPEGVNMEKGSKASRKMQHSCIF